MGQVFDLIGRPDEYRDEGGGEGPDGQSAMLRQGVNFRLLAQQFVATVTVPLACVFL